MPKQKYRFLVHTYKIIIYQLSAQFGFKTDTSTCFQIITYQIPNHVTCWSSQLNLVTSTLTKISI